MQGTRLPDDTDWSHTIPNGAYWRKDACWVGITPNGLLSSLANHTVTEHEDGTITVTPSILTRSAGREWHGYLERGVWRTV